MTDIDVAVSTPSASYGYGETIPLQVTVENVAAVSLLIVEGPAYIWKGTGDTIHVLLAEAPIADGVGYYGYSPPKLRWLRAGRMRTIDVSVGMPPRTGALDGLGRYVWHETPVSGDVILDVTVGYRRHSFRPQTAAPWAEFLEGQETASPVQIMVQVAAL